jgi:hypothetical protein
MGQKSQFQVGMKQREKRKKKRNRLVKKGQDLKDFYYGKYYLKLGA